MYSQYLSSFEYKERQQDVEITSLPRYKPKEFKAKTKKRVVFDQPFCKHSPHSYYQCSRYRNAIHDFDNTVLIDFRKKFDALTTPERAEFLSHYIHWNEIGRTALRKKWENGESKKRYPGTYEIHLNSDLFHRWRVCPYFFRWIFRMGATRWATLMTLICKVSFTYKPY